MLTHFRSLYGLTQTIDLDYRLNMIFTHELDDEYVLVTTPERPWAILSQEEYGLLMAHRIETLSQVYCTLHDLGVIITQANAQQVAQRYAAKYQFLFDPPSLHIIVLTNRCNMACLYCHAEAGTVADRYLDMSEEIAMKTIDFFFTIPPGRSRRKTIEFQGGETLLRYDLMQKVIDYATEKANAQEVQIKFAIASNLILMNDEIAADIQRRGNVQVCTSVDGPASIHNQQRVFPTGQATYQRTMYWVDRLKRVYGLCIGMLPTCTIHHLGHEAEIVDFFTQKERSFYVRTVNRTGKAHEEGTYDALGMTASQVIEFWQKSLEYVLEKSRKGDRTVEIRTQRLLRNMFNLTSTYMCMRSPCGAATSQLVVSERGKIHACDAGRSIEMLVLGNVMTHSYQDIITCDIAKALRSMARETMPKCNTCAFSPYCQYCCAQAINVEGGPISKMPMDHQCQISITMIPYLFRKFLNPEDARTLSSWV